jgi:hypothetical protein
MRMDEAVTVSFPRIAFHRNQNKKRHDRLDFADKFAPIFPFIRKQYIMNISIGAENENSMRKTDYIMDSI